MINFVLQSRQNYQYKPLRENEIRLIRLRHSSRPDNIKCNIQHFQLNSCPPYIALSYTWGDPFGQARTILTENLEFPPEDTYSSAQQENITLNGRPMHVQKNLYLFLQNAQPDIDAPGSFLPHSASHLENERRLRYEDSQANTLGHFWVDAICIDQENIEERNSQVAKMAEIYEKSSKIVAWLGPPDLSSDTAVATIADLSNFFESLLATREGMWDKIGPSDAPDLDWPHLGALKCFRARAWWSRAWIIQEFSTPTQYPVVLWCGPRKVSWDQIARTNLGLIFTALETNNLYNSRLILFEHLRKIRKDPSRHGHLNLKNLLKACWPFSATDPRDKLYAILSMTADGKHESLRPDYSLPVEELYYRLAMYVLNADGNLDFLSFCDPRHVLEIPSWVPDWSVWKQWGEIIRPKAWMLPCENIYYASGKRATKIAFLSYTQHLIVEGIEIDVIVEASEPRTVIDRIMTEDEEHNIAVTWSKFLFLSGTNESYTAGGTMLDAAGHTLCADVSWQNPWTDKVSIHRGSSVSSLLKDLMSKKIKGSWNQVFSSPAVHYTTLYRRLIRTQQNYIGICCDYAEVGDRICILFGAQVPFVLRPSGACWKVIGEAYVHGIMDGEALTGEPNIKTFELN